MKIIETDIPDVTINNLDESKIDLANSVIENIYPLFDDFFKEKLRRVYDLKIEIKAKAKKIKSEKESMQVLMSEYSRRKKVAKLLDRTQNLVNAGLTYDGQIKHETVILLKIVDKLTNEKLDEQIRHTIQTVSKRFAK